MSTDLATDIEPAAQTDAEEYNCKFLKNGDVKTCAQAFLIIQSHHDYCPHDTLTRYEEELFHEWESKCHGCSIVRKYDATLNACPKVDCLDTTVAELGYEVLNETCVAADTALAFEWAGSFDTPAASYTWVSQAATKVNPNDVFPANHSYKDAEMKVVAFKMTSTLKSAMWPKRDKADEIMSTGSCPEVTASCTPGDVSCASKPTITPTTAGACVTVKFPTDASKDFHATVDTDGVAHVAFFTAHVPIEFERDTHYFMSTDLATDIEPAAQTDAEEYNCKFLKNGDVKTCAQAFLIIQSHHDYCPHDTLTRYEEELFHEWESKCHGCSIVRKYDATLNACPKVDCLDTTVAELGYEVLNETCTAADTSLAFEWAGSFDTPGDSYTWVSQAATKVNANDVFPANHSYADAEMKVVAFKMTSTLKSDLFAKRDDADALMTTGSCPPVTVSCTPGDAAGCASKPTITPTTAGACVTVQFPTDASKDFYATVNTAGVAHVAFFTAHVPVEFERDTHYFMSNDLATDIEPVHELGASAGHDHGRRLLEVSLNDRHSRRRLANPGSCCNTNKQRGAWKQVVSYHDQCDHDQVPTYIEVGFHDYEASCEDYFCNLIGPDEDQTVCPYAPPSPPPLPSLPPSPSSPVVTESTGIEEGTLIGVIVAAVVVAAILLAGVCCLVAKEKAGKPLFTNLDAPASNP